MTQECKSMNPCQCCAVRGSGTRKKGQMLVIYRNGLYQWSCTRRVNTDITLEEQFYGFSAVLVYAVIERRSIRA